jgi:hypothetical protein
MPEENKSYLLIQTPNAEDDVRLRTLYKGKGKLEDWMGKLDEEPSAEIYSITVVENAVIGSLFFERYSAKRKNNYDPSSEDGYEIELSSDRGEIDFLKQILDEVKPTDRKEGR